MSDLIVGYVRHMRAAGMSRATTIVDREEILRRIDRDLIMGLEKATVEELADWLGHDGWSAKTRCTYYEAVRGFFAWACNPRNPVLDYDPSLSLARPKTYPGTPKPVSVEEMAAVLKHLKGFWYIAALLASHEGARACEVVSIEKEDITENTVTFHGKGGKVAAVPTHPLLWRSVRDFPPGSLAETGLGRPITAKYLSATFPRIVRRDAGLNRINFHRLRHWFATTLLLDKELGGAGADLRTVQELMRHSSPAMTAVYTAITDRQRKMAVSALPDRAPTPI